MKPKLTLRQVLEQLKDEGHPISQGPAQFVFRAQEPQASPWYIRLFAGIGAWFAAMFFVAFVLTIGLLTRNEFINLGFGLVICIIAVAIYRSKHDQTFMEQFSLSLSILGQVIAGISLAVIFDDVILVALSIIILEVGLIGFYNNQFHRFLSYLVIIVSMVAIVYDIAEMRLIPGFTSVIVAGLVALMIYEPYLWISAWWEILHPLRYALMIGGLGLPLHTLVMVDQQFWVGSALIMLGIMGWVAWMINRELRHSLGPAWLWVLLVLGLGLAALSVSVPGIMVALIVLVLGFWRNNYIVQGLAVMALFYYLGAYYYTLHTTLLIKSMILTGTGILVLSSRLIGIRFNQQED